MRCFKAARVPASMQATGPRATGPGMPGLHGGTKARETHNSFAFWARR